MEVTGHPNAVKVVHGQITPALRLWKRKVKDSGKLDELKNFTHRGLIVTAQSDKYDFVARCFFPGLGIDEDPVTGSAHTLLTPYWSERLGKPALRARQLSQREGLLTCRLQGDRVLLKGQAVTYLRGMIFI